LKKNLPLARSARLIVKELPDEVLVYDLETDKAYCLNQTAARVWMNCDGLKTVAQVRELMETETGSTVPEEMVWLALEQLEKSHLLDRSRAEPFHPVGKSRREVMRRIGMTAVALPLIISITAPLASAQGSPCRTINQTCSAAQRCCLPLHCDDNNGTFVCQN
jgi:hypothetical protein